jgi:hypothetical protein
VFLNLSLLKVILIEVSSISSHLPNVWMEGDEKRAEKRGR